jgi:hypothetical protein
MLLADPVVLRMVLHNSVLCSERLPVPSLLLLLPQGALDNMNLFQVITIMAFFMLLPVSILFEGLPCLPAKMAAAVSCLQRHTCSF